MMPLVTATLDDFAPRPLIRRTEKFMQLCDFYRNATGKYSHSSYTMFEVIHDHSLSFGLRHFKLFSENRVITVFWKWERITGNVGNNSGDVRWGMLVGYRVAISRIDGTV